MSCGETIASCVKSCCRWLAGWSARANSYQKELSDQVALMKKEMARLICKCRDTAYRATNLEEELGKAQAQNQSLLNALKKIRGMFIVRSQLHNDQWHLQAMTMADLAERAIEGEEVKDEAVAR